LTIFEHFFSLGLIIAGSSFGLMLGGFVWQFTDLRKLIPRLFDEYKQDELSENLAKLDKSLVGSARRIFFSGFFFAAGIFLSIIGVLNS
jgi:flagellar motor component MotA